MASVNIKRAQLFYEREQAFNEREQAFNVKSAADRVIIDAQNARIVMFEQAQQSAEIVHNVFGDEWTESQTEINLRNAENIIVRLRHINDNNQNNMQQLRTDNEILITANTIQAGRILDLEAAHILLVADHVSHEVSDDNDEEEEGDGEPEDGETLGTDDTEHSTDEDSYEGSFIDDSEV